MADPRQLRTRPLGLLRRGWAERSPGQWWKEDSPGRGLRGVHPGSILVCRVLVDPAERFRELTGRGGGPGWIVDTEVFWADPRTRKFSDWVYHQESRSPDEGSARGLAAKMMSWLDRRSLESLVDVPGSGPLAMSRPPELDVSAWTRLGAIVNG